MISIDFEFTSLNPDKGAVSSVGAVDLFNPQRTYYKEYRVPDEAEIVQESLDVSGFTMGQLKDASKPTFVEDLRNFIEWVNGCSSAIFVGQNMVLDMTYFKKAFETLGQKWPWGYRNVDLHAVAFAKVVQQTGNEPLRPDGHSDLNLDAIAKMVGMSFQRDKAHNALVDAKMTAECLHRLLFNKSLFAEFE